MPLNFPTGSLTVGQIYQSGSVMSPSYKWNGQYWEVFTNARDIEYTTPYSDFIEPRQNVSWLQTGGVGGTLFIADDVLYGIKGNNGSSIGYSNAPGIVASGSTANNYNVGIKYAYPIPFPNESGSRIVSASANKLTGLVLFDNGNLYGWGRNAAGELGLGTDARIYQPALITSGVIQIFPNDMTSMADDDAYDRILFKKSDGWIYGAGYNGRGGLGLGSATPLFVTNPTRIDGIGQDPMFVANVGGLCGGIIAQKSGSGQIVGCGYNNSGWLGIGNTTQQNSFVTLSLWNFSDASLRVKKVFGNQRFYANGTWEEGYGFMCMWMSSTGSGGDYIKVAGNTYYGANGRGVTTNANSLVPGIALMPIATPFTDVFWAGAPVAIYVQTGSQIYSWGKNDYGQLGYSNVNTTPQAWPSCSLAITGVLEVLHKDSTPLYNGFRAQSPVFKLEDGNYYMCGYGESGQLGVGENVATARNTSPKKINLPPGTDLKHVGTINTNDYNNTFIGVTKDNRFLVWGKNNGYGTIDAYSGYEFFAPVQKTPKTIYK